MASVSRFEAKPGGGGGGGGTCGAAPHTLTLFKTN